MRRARFVSVAAGLIAGGLLLPAGAQTLTAKDAIARLFTAPAPQQAWFAPSFLTAVPFDRVRQITASITAALGPYRSIQPNGEGFTVQFERGTAQAVAQLDANGAFTGLRFHGFQSAAGAARMQSLFTTKTVPAEWFTAAFLDKFPIDQVRTVIGGIVSQLGTFVTLTPRTDGSYEGLFSGGSIDGEIGLDADGKIVYLVFKAPQPTTR